MRHPTRTLKPGECDNRDLFTCSRSGARAGPLAPKIGSELDDIGNRTNTQVRGIGKQQLSHSAVTGPDQFVQIDSRATTIGPVPFSVTPSTWFLVVTALPIFGWVDRSPALTSLMISAFAIPSWIRFA